MILSRFYLISLKKLSILRRIEIRLFFHYFRIFIQIRFSTFAANPVILNTISIAASYAATREIKRAICHHLWFACCYQRCTSDEPHLRAMPYNRKKYAPLARNEPRIKFLQSMIEVRDIIIILAMCSAEASIPLKSSCWNSYICVN